MTISPRIRLEPSLVQAVIDAQLEQSDREGNAQMAREYHALVDPIYTHATPDESEHAFERVHMQFFEQLGFVQLVANAWQEFPELEAKSPSLLLLMARAHHEEGAVIGRDGTSVCLRIMPLRFVNRERASAFVRHELLHASDMLDPAFGYEITPAPTRAQSDRVAECYQTLWCTSVDGRLSRRERAALTSCDEHRRTFDACFDALSDAARAELFERVWSGERISHAEILARAREIRAAGPQKIPGALCPLCSFPTHRWLEIIEPSLATLIQADFADWRETDGVCERCAESYALVLNQ